MKTALVVIAAVLAACLISLAGVVIWGRSHITETAWDDPAVASCEWLALREDVYPAQEYRRVDALIEGNRVSLTFTVEALNTKPELQTKICEFELNGTTVLFARPKSNVNCDAELAAVRAGGQSAILRKRLEACKNEMEQHLSVLLGQLKTELPLTLTGVYPIAREKTKLSFN